MNTLPKEFFASIVIAVTGLSQNLLTQWLDRTHIRASTPASGSGTRNKFTIDDICRIELFKLLNESGFTRSMASRIAFAPLVDPANPTGDLLHMCVCDWECYYKKTRPVSTILNGMQLRPKSYYIGYLRSDKGVSSYPLLTPGHFRDLYQYLDTEKSAICHVVNLSIIVEKVFEKIDKL